MFYGRSKRVIILKDIHSNLFEEAILVLKEDRDKDNGGAGKESGSKTDTQKNDFILREAENIINNYIKNNKSTLAPVKREPIHKEGTFGRKVNESKFMKNLIINSALIGSIAAVAFLLIQLF